MDDEQAVRDRWEQVLGAVNAHRRVPAVVLGDDATVLGCAGGVLTVGFAHSFYLRQFLAGPGPGLLADAVEQVVGTRVVVDAVLLG